MNIVQIIEKKKFGKQLSKEEINFFISGYVEDKIPDYQISSLLMAIRLNGMTDYEIFYLTEAMVNSGETIDLSEIEGFKIDKHSTGGIGDKVTLIVAPILASLGIPVAKFSGKGLGITGGTIDKLESIRGFNTELTIEEFISNVKNIGIAVAGQTGKIVPADKKLYALRDVTGTVDSIPLIASSVMSKKIASGSDGIVLDVKYGNGAFMKTKKEAQILADKMVTIGENFNKKVVAHLSDMNNPLGRYIGNKLEVVEAYELLNMNNKHTHDDLLEACVIIACEMYKLSTDCDDEFAKQQVQHAIESGKAKDKFIELIQIQGGDINDVVIRETDYVVEVKSNKDGYVEYVNALLIGEVSVELGAGRLTKESQLDYDAGIQLITKHHENVKVGQTLAYLYSNKEIKQETIDKVLDAYHVV